MAATRGIGASPGIAIATAIVLDDESLEVLRKTVASEDVEGELRRIDRAYRASKKEVGSLLREQDKNSDVHRIVQTHLAFLEDEEIRSGIEDGIRSDRFQAQYAVTRVVGQFIEAFERMEDVTLSTRSSDLRDVERRLVRNLEGRRTSPLAGETDEASVLVARDLTPSQAASLDPTAVCGFAMEVGGLTSHTAIVARSLGIPAVVGIRSLLDQVAPGDTVIIDGSSGTVVVNPDEGLLSSYREKRRRLMDSEEQAAKTAGLPTVTKDGKRCTILGNIEFPWEMETLRKHHGDGVGLLRTEFLYLDSLDAARDEESHVGTYQEIAQACEGRPFTIRTLDLGSDKSPVELGMTAEPNPALGVRSLRFCFANRDLFSVQLRAILRVSQDSNVRLMFPMVSSIEELAMARAALEEAKAELRAEGILFDEDIKVGIMIEVPSAALMANELARNVDFFSIGSNDLIQYTLAVDRVNEGVASLYQPGHPAVLRLLKMIIDAADAAKIEVSLCGEMAADPELVVLLTGLGLRTLSLTPGAIPTIKRVLRETSATDAQKLAESCLAASTAEEVMKLLRKSL